MIRPITGMNLLLQSEEPQNIDVPGPKSYSQAGDDDQTVAEWMDTITDMSYEEKLAHWHKQKEYIFEHRKSPIKLFNTETVTKSGSNYQVVHKKPYGHNDRPVLERSKRFTEAGHQIGKVISLQYMVDSDKSIAQASKQVPFEVSDDDLDTIEKFFSTYDAAWVIPGDGPGGRTRFPLSDATSYSGMIYFMYILNPTGQEIPRYIGMSRKLGRDDRSLGSNFANITRDSVFGRWGYGSSQHLGELSRAVFQEYYDSDPENKYEEWDNALFIDNSRVLKCPIYIEMVPFFNKDIRDAEEKLIRLASRLFGDILLNKEYADD